MHGYCLQSHHRTFQRFYFERTSFIINCIEKPSFDVIRERFGEVAQICGGLFFLAAIHEKKPINTNVHVDGDCSHFDDEENNNDEEKMDFVTRWCDMSIIMTVGFRCGQENLYIQFKNLSSMLNLFGENNATESNQWPHFWERVKFWHVSVEKAFDD